MKIEDYSKYYVQGSDHYLLPKDIFIELFNEMNNWKEDCKKKQDVIDKAIRHIEKELGNINEKTNEFEAYGDLDYAQDEVEELYKILKKGSGIDERF